jgi:thioredoxin-like negative regulator of GroEL
MTGVALNVTSEDQFERIVSNSAPGTVLVLNFWADWAEPCEQMNDVFDELARVYGSGDALRFLKAFP